MYRVFPPSEPPDGGRPRFFRLVIVGGTQLRGSWYLSAIVRLQGFSSGSPAASPRRWSPKTVTTSSMVGRSEPGCALCPALSFKDLHHPCRGGERGEPGLYLPHGSAGHLFFQLLVVETILQLCGGGVLQPCPPAMPGKANCCCSARMQHFVLCPRFRGEDGSEDLPVRFGAACARWCGAGGQADVAVGADVMAAGESFSAVEAVSAVYGPTSGSLALTSGSRPLSGDANESLPVAASVLGPWLLLQRSLASHLELVTPRAPRCGGCSYPRGRNRSSVCNGTLNAGDCSLWLSGPEHVCIFGTELCFFPISSTRTCLSAN
jgi:hypothetical protein